MFENPLSERTRSSSVREAAKMAALAFMIGTPGCQRMIDGMNARARQRAIDVGLEANARVLEQAAERGTPRRFDDAIRRELPPTHEEFEANEHAVAMSNIVTVHTGNGPQPESNAAVLEQKIFVRMGDPVQPHTYAATDARRLAIQIPIMRGGHFRVTGYGGMCEVVQARTDPGNRLGMYVRTGSLTERLLSAGGEIGQEKQSEGHGLTYTEAMQDALLNVANPHQIIRDMPHTASRPVVDAQGHHEDTGFITDPPHRSGGRTVYSCGHSERSQTIVINDISEELGGGSRPGVTVRFTYHQTQEPNDQIQPTTHP